jgi:hypothetical protein
MMAGLAAAGYRKIYGDRTFDAPIVSCHEGSGGNDH